ncbi:MAG: transglutaminase-like domain-containing protein [Defluviitaleaceae bacterium]|nr:transglutaminase-like domain-containing protein [Defluviitaleaceae bacterium]
MGAIKHKNKTAIMFTLLVILGIYTVTGGLGILPRSVPLAASPSFEIPVPTASGINVRRNNKAEIDYSNTHYGYVKIRYLEETTANVRVLITGPSGTRYQYHLNTEGLWEVFPLSDGDGHYSIGVFVQVSGNRFATANNANIDIILVDEFAPFLRPNQFVNFNRESNAVLKAAELTRDSQTVIDTVSVIFNFVITNIEYDFELAANVRAGYIPDIDLVLKRGKGICFDYAALMSAMLRSQGIPTKLVIGYVGNVLHAWISVYSIETGWINNIIWFDGLTWRIMDPTFAAADNLSDEVMRFIGNGSNHNPIHFH